MRFSAFVWRADAKSFPGQKGDVVHFVEVEFAELEGDYRGPMCVVSAQEGVDSDFAGEGRYVVSAHFRRKDRATVLSIESLERAAVVAPAKGATVGKGVQGSATRGKGGAAVVGSAGLVEGSSEPDGDDDIPF